MKIDGKHEGQSIFVEDSQGVVLVQVDDGCDSPTISLTAEGARKLAAAIIVAADKIDPIGKFGARCDAGANEEPDRKETNP